MWGIVKGKFETYGAPSLAVSQFGKVYMCIVYWIVHLVDQHIISYVLLVISELERMWKEAAGT